MSVRPQITVISHTYVVGINRAKFQRLADYADLSLLVPAYWRDTIRTMPLDPLEPNAHYQLHPLPIFFNGRPARFFYSPFPLMRILKQIRPRLVHIEAEPVGLSFLQISLLKMLYAFRLCFFTWQNIHSPTTLIERFNLSHADMAIAGNAEAASVLRTKGFLHPIHVIPQLGVEPPAETITFNTKTESHFRIGYIGRLIPEKGLFILLEALSALPGNWQAQFIGHGPSLSALKKQIESMDLTERIHFPGALPHTQIFSALQQLDVLVLPSLTTPTWKEQFGHVLIEAMACGVPVIGSDSGAIPEVIGDAGIIVPEGQSAPLRDALLQLMRNPQPRAALSRKGRERVAQEFTHSQIALKTWQAWQSIL